MTSPAETRALEAIGMESADEFRQILTDLNLGPRPTLRDLVRAVEKRCGRRIRIMPPTKENWNSAMALTVHSDDHLMFVRPGLSELHFFHCVLHELVHILIGDPGRTSDSLEAATFNPDQQLMCARLMHECEHGGATDCVEGLCGLEFAVETLTYEMATSVVYGDVPEDLWITSR